MGAAVSTPTTTTNLTVLEYADWTPGCEWECERRATGLDACHWCPDGDSLMCDEHHMEFIAYIAENLAADVPLVCLFCDHELHSTADRDWRPL